jgi:hypothetical protein
MNFSLIVGIYGALVASLVAIIQFLGYRRDRHNIVVRVRGGYAVHPPNPEYTAKSYICVTVANRGRRVVTITMAGIMGPKGRSSSAFLAADSIQKGPREISEGKAETYLLVEDDIGFTPDKYVAFAFDATGRMYWSHSVFRRLLKLGRIR